MQRTARGYRPAYGRHTPPRDTDPRNTVHTVQGTGSTCNYDVYSYHDQHTRGYAEDKYDVYNKYHGGAPGGAGAWQQTQPESAYASYACQNQSQYAKHDRSAWLPTPLARDGQHDVPGAQAAYTGQYAKHDRSAWLPTPLARDGQHDVTDGHAAFCVQYTNHDGNAWLSTFLAQYGQHNAPDAQAAFCGQYAKQDGSTQLSSKVMGNWQQKENEAQAAFQGLCYTEREGTGTKRLIETLATVGGRQGDGGQAGEQDRSVKMRKLYDPGNVQPLDDYDIEDWGLGFGIGD